MQLAIQPRQTLRLQPRLVHLDSGAPSDHDDLVDGSDRLDSMSLLRGQKAVEIHHNGSVYRLQATKLGKLILTK